MLYWLKSSSLKPVLSSWGLLHHLIHCFINKIHYNTFYTPTTVSSQLYFPLRFSDQNSVCVCRIHLTWNTSFPPGPSSFHQPSNISSRLIIKEQLAICTRWCSWECRRWPFWYTASFVVEAHMSLLFLWE